MEEEESIASELRLIESKQQNMRETLNQVHDKASSILSFTVQWKDIEDHFDSARIVIGEKEKELHSVQERVGERLKEVEIKERDLTVKEKELEAIQELVKEGLEGMEEKEKELEGMREVLNGKFVEIEVREKKLEELQELVKQRFREIELKEKEIKGDEEMVKKKLGEIEVREKEMQGTENSAREKFGEMEVKERGIELKEHELKGIQQTMKEGLKEAERKEKEVEGMKEEVQVKGKECEKLLSELKVKEKQVEKQSRELKFKEQRVRKRFADFLVKEKKFQDEVKELKLKDGRVVERFKEIELKEKETQEKCAVLEKKEKFEEKCGEFKLKETQVEEQLEVLKLKQNQLEECIKEVEMEKEKIMERNKELEELHRKFDLKDDSFIDTNVKTETIDHHMVESAGDPKDADLTSSVTMDGKALQIFLNQHFQEHDCRSGEVEVALRVSSDPAMLVLHGMEGFYPPHLKNGDLEFEAGVARRSCILLLEQLMKLSPEISPHVKTEAMKIASDWSKKMTVNPAHSLEVLGFLQLLASYRLASAFDSNKLWKYFQIVPQYNQAPELFSIFGFSGKISVFIRNLIGKKQQAGAVRFICAFDLVHKFPPGPLLKEYLEVSKLAAKKMAKENKSHEAQIETTNRRITDLKVVLRCIEDHKIECEISPKKLKTQIELWEKENVKRKQMLLELKHLAPKVEIAAASPVIVSKSGSKADTSSPCYSSTVSTAILAESTEFTGTSLTVAPITASSASTATVVEFPPPITVAPPSPTATPTTTLSPNTVAASILPSTVTPPSPSTTPIATNSATMTAPPISPIKVTSLSTAPTSATPKNQGIKMRSRSHNGGGKKRPRASATSEVPRKVSVIDTNRVNSAHHHHQQPTSFFNSAHNPQQQQPSTFFMNQGVPALMPSAGYYNLDGTPYPNLLYPPYCVMPMPPWRY